MRTTHERGRRTWIDRILATGVAIVLALQPVARASSPCTSRGPDSPNGCCCAGERATSCCERPARRGDPRQPVVRREACGCSLRTPIAPLALTGSAEAREVKSSGSAWTQDWITVGAQTSAATPVPQLAFGPDPPGRAETLRTPWPCSREPAGADLCAHGIHALLASLGTLLR